MIDGTLPSPEPHVDEALSRSFDRLEATRGALARRLDGVDRARLNRRRDDGGWSALQVLHHVVVSEEASIGYIRKKVQAGLAIPRAGLRSRLRLLALQLAHASPMRFKAPAPVASVPEEIDPSALLARWEATRSAWRELLDGFPPELVERQVFRHPLVGRMGLRDTLGFMQSHLDHHVRQVEQTLDRP